MNDLVTIQSSHATTGVCAAAQIMDGCILDNGVMYQTEQKCPQQSGDDVIFNRCEHLSCGDSVDSNQYKQSVFLDQKPIMTCGDHGALSFMGNKVARMDGDIVESHNGLLLSLIDGKPVSESVMGCDGSTIPVQDGRIASGENVLANGKYMHMKNGVLVKIHEGGLKDGRIVSFDSTSLDGKLFHIDGRLVHVNGDDVMRVVDREGREFTMRTRIISGEKRVLPAIDVTHLENEIHVHENVLPVHKTIIRHHIDTINTRLVVVGEPKVEHKYSTIVYGDHLIYENGRLVPLGDNKLIQSKTDTTPAKIDESTGGRKTVEEVST